MLSAGLTIIAFLAATGLWTADGVYVDVACPGVNSELQCPEGQMIEVMKMENGLKGSVDCADRGTPVESASSECLHTLMLPWSKFICDKMQSCRLPKPHPSMFMCKDDTKDNFLQYTYNCINQPPGMRTVIACEGETAALKCENGLIEIVKAVYGRSSSDTCINTSTDTPSTMTFCSSVRAQQIVENMCSNEAECDIEATSETLGRALKCGPAPKYLEVHYVCV